MYKELRTKELIALASAADRFNTNPSTSVIDMRDANAVRFVINKTASTEAVKITVTACNSAGTGTAIADYLVREGVDTLDGATETAGAAAGVTCAVTSTLVAVDISARALKSGTTEYGYVKLTLTETVNDPCVAGVTAHIDPQASY